MSDDDFSDFSDADSDEYGATPARKRSGAKKSRTSEFKVKNALKPPRPTTYTVQALYDQIHGCDINLEPDYQRDVVWPEAKQIGIIDSIFRNFYIPPVIFAVLMHEDGSETRTCIDGKQRLTSIYRFLDGLIPHKDPFTGEKLWYKDVGPTKGAKRKNILPEKMRRLFANKQIVCVEYHEITDHDEREIFQRVQLGMALTPAEKLQVVNSPHAQFIRELQADYLKEDGGLTTSALDWDRSRGSDFRCLAQAIYTIDKYSSAFKTAPTILQLEKWLSDDTPVTALFRKKIKDTFDILVLLVHEKSTKAAFKKPAKVSPVEFILIVVLIAVWKDTMSLAELSESVGKMREDVRMYHSDIRMNTKVTKTMLDFMRGLKASKTAPDQTAAAVTKSKPPPSSAAAPREKRKRETDKMDVDEEHADNDNEPSGSSESSEEEQVAKKVKRSPPTATTSSTATISASLAKSGSGLPNLHPTLTSGTAGPRVASLGTTPTERDRPQSSQVRPQSQLPTPSQPPAVTIPPGAQRPPTQPKMDRLAGLRAARAAAGFVQPMGLSQTPTAPARSVSGNGIGNGAQSPRTPTTPFVNFKGGLGVPSSQPQPPSQGHGYSPHPLPLRHNPASANLNSTPLPLPSPSLPSTSMENILSSSLSRGLPPPPTNSGRIESERERKEREQWEIERYGRVQHLSHPPEYGWTAVKRK